MSEMDYESIPEVHVPLVRDWFSPAFDAWTRFLYPSNRRFFVFGSCLFLILFGWLVIFKLFLWAAVSVVLLLAFALTIPWDLATYKHRRQLAYENELYGWAKEVFQNPREGF